VYYSAQLKFKSQEVKDNLERIGKLENGEILPIISAPNEYRYRNKLEFSFSSNRWLSLEEVNSEKKIESRNALGYHVPGMWDKIIDIDECHLQQEPSNSIRLFVKNYALNNGLTFFHPRDKKGLLRTMMLRSSSENKWMFVLQFFEDPENEGLKLLEAVKLNFPQIVSIYYAHNTKGNDSIYDLDLILFHGESSLIEKMPSVTSKGRTLSFKVGPKSFYQTNSSQAYVLYCEVLKMAKIKSNDVVYDLYTGTGTIALFMAQIAKKVIGIESVQEAIDAAKQNALDNNIVNTEFIVGDMREVFNEALWNEHGKPDVLITDPPRDGMHPKVVQKLLDLKIPKIVYVSCNTATQARDLDLMRGEYQVESVQPVDMFPQTHHIENILLLKLKSN
jgi:23S rRNA (uracil1939-C5)-methyltransferase